MNTTNRTPHYILKSGRKRREGKKFDLRTQEVKFFGNSKPKENKKK